MRLQRTKKQSAECASPCNSLSLRAQKYHPGSKRESGMEICCGAHHKWGPCSPVELPLGVPCATILGDVPLVAQSGQVGLCPGHGDIPGQPVAGQGVCHDLALLPIIYEIQQTRRCGPVSRPLPSCTHACSSPVVIPIVQIGDWSMRLLLHAPAGHLIEFHIGLEFQQLHVCWHNLPFLLLQCTDPLGATSGYTVLWAACPSSDSYQELLMCLPCSNT
jgi:hypothetical protein